MKKSNVKGKGKKKPADEKKTAGEKEAAKKRSPSGARKSVDILGSLAPEESTEVLRLLLSRHRDLRKEVEEIARGLVSTATPDLTADAVESAVSALDWEDADGRAGRTRSGYVEPTEAAWQILHEAVESFFIDMKRKASVGLVEAAELTCRGIIIGLYRAREFNGDALLAWAEDFPGEDACFAAEELIRAVPRPLKKRTAVHLLDALADEVPEWVSMLRRVLKLGAGRRR